MNKTATFRKKNQGVVDCAIKILNAERPMTLRQLFYRLISAGVLTNSKKDYNRLGNVMTRLREERSLPLDWIVDHVRSTLKPSSWSGLGSFGDAVRRTYRKDFWASLPHHVEIFVEKDAIAGTIEPVTHEYDIRLHVCRGYASISFAGMIAAQWRRIVKPIFAYYLGDFDPSGFDIERDLRDKLERYSGKAVRASEDGTLCCVWKRLAVLSNDFGQHNLIRLPVKKDDKRAAKFIAERGEACAEVDAIAPTELRRRVKAAIETHIDQERWAKLKETERLEKQTIALMQWDDGENESSLTFLN